MAQSASSPFLTWYLVFLEQINVFVVFLSAGAILFTRSTGVAYCVLGVVMCVSSVKLLKKVIRQPRPPHTSQESQPKGSYGMPSTHSAVTGYYTCYIYLSCLYLQLHRFFSLGSEWSMVFFLVFLPCTASVVLSRVWLGHHTWPQVAVGTAYGVTFGLGWFTMWIKGVD